MVLFHSKGFNFHINEGQQFHTMAKCNFYTETQNYLPQIRVLNSYTNQTNTIRHLWHVTFLLLFFQTVLRQLMKNGTLFLHLLSIQGIYPDNCMYFTSFWYFWYKQYSNEDSLSFVRPMCIFGRVKGKEKLIMINEYNTKRTGLYNDCP